MTPEHLRHVWDRRESQGDVRPLAGIHFDTDLVGPSGCAVTLYVSERHTRMMIKHAKITAQNRYDVEVFYTVRVPDAWYDELPNTPAEDPLHGR